LIGFGTWTAFGAGRVMVGFDSGNALFDTAEETGGSADSVVVSHTHSINDPSHSHGVTADNDGAGSSGTTFKSDNQAIQTLSTNSAATGITLNSTGSSGINANYQPYITVYMWKRTA